MKISGINGTAGTSVAAGQINLPQESDPVSKRIQKQIAEAQEELQGLAADKELSQEEKMKKRQELQQRITDLNSQLRLHQMERRRERQQAQKAPEENMAGSKQREKAGHAGNGMSKASMESMISASKAMEQAKAYGSVSTHLEGRARTLQSEIDTDKKRGLDVKGKEDELSKLQERMEKAKSSQISTLDDANKGLKEAREAEQKEKAGEKGKTAPEEREEEKREAASQESRPEDPGNISRQDAEPGRFVDTQL